MLIVVVGRMGMSVAVAPRVILRRKTPRVSGICTRSISALPSIALLLTRTSTPSTGTASSSRSSTSVAPSPRILTQHVAGARDRYDIAFVQHGVGRRLPRSSRCGGGAARRCVESGTERLGLDHAQAHGLAALGDAKRAHFPAPPGCCRDRRAP